LVHAIWSGGELATPIRRTVQDYLREVMTMIDFPDVTETQAVDFICSGCEAPYKVVRVKADARPPGRPTIEGEKAMCGQVSSPHPFS
jgi:hypothetical protein